jgi:hypothetical protein
MGVTGYLDDSRGCWIEDSERIHARGMRYQLSTERVNIKNLCSSDL